MISIIVPVYNVERYIADCIVSVLNQSCSDWELLLVVDGATDGSLSICREYADRDTRVRVIAKENGGVSSARNAGIREAAGDYLMFLDGDDYLEADALPSMLATVERTGADACYCRCYYKDDNVCDTAIPVETPAVIRGEEAVRRHLHAGFVVSPCFSLAKTSLVRDVFFNESIHTLEDWEYNFRQLTRLDRIAVLNKPLYHYRTVMGSASKSCLNERKLTCFLIPDTVTAYVKERKSPYEREARYVPIFLLYHMLVILANGTYDAGSAACLKRQARRHWRYAITSRDVSPREKIYVTMAVISPRLFCASYKLKYRIGAHA